MPAAPPDSACHVLILDDDPQVLRLFERILSCEGYAVITTNSGPDAMEILAARPIDLLVLDLSMPEPDGFEILQSLRRERPSLAILVVSGYMQGPLLEASEMLGASASLTKTEAPKRLAETVARVLHHAHAGSRGRKE